MALPRFLYRNVLVATPGVILTGSFELASMPRSNVLKASLSTRWRSASGWTFTAANNTLRFNRGGVKTATIAIGTYATGALAATAVRTALAAADGGLVWTVVYTTSNRFQISGTLAFVLEFGTLVTTSAHVDLGFASVTTASGTLHSSSSATYQSRQVLNVDLGSAVAMSGTMAHGHNLTSAGDVTFQADTASLVSVGFADTTTPDLHYILHDWLADPLGIGFSATAKQYLRLIVSDVANPAGYVELAVWYVGMVAEVSVLPSVEYGKDNEHLSEIVYAEGGAHMRVPRARRRVYRLFFQLEQRNGLASSDRVIFDAIDALGIGTPFFANFDVPYTGTLPGSPPTSFFVYGFLREGISEPYVVGTYWGITMSIAEVLEVALLTGLVSYWRLTEAGGNRADAVGANTLTDSGAVGSAAGKIGPTLAANFLTASSQTLICLDNAALSMGVGVSWTIALWVYATVRTGLLQVFVSKDDTIGQREFVIYENSGGGGLFVQAFQAPATSVAVAATLPLNVWSHVICWFSTADSKLHLQFNGGTVADSSTTITHTFDGTAPFKLGSRNGEFLQGRIQHVGLWKRVLTSDERAALWNGGMGLDFSFFDVLPPSQAAVTTPASPLIGRGQLGLSSDLRTFADLVGGAE